MWCGVGALRCHAMTPLLLFCLLIVSCFFALKCVPPVGCVLCRWCLWQWFCGVGTVSFCWCCCCVGVGGCGSVIDAGVAVLVLVLLALLLCVGVSVVAVPGMSVVLMLSSLQNCRLVSCVSRHLNRLPVTTTAASLRLHRYQTPPSSTRRTSATTTARQTSEGRCR